MEQILGPQSIYQLFAENLRRQCNRFESIAAFCRKSGINRQQFNRYLAGQNLPNPASLRKICATLGVSETSLFESRPQRGGGAAKLEPDELAALRKFTQGLPREGLAALAHAAEALRGGANIQGGIQPGTYVAHLPLPDYPGQILRTVLKVSRIGDLTVFTRRTSFRPPGSSSTSLTVGKHVGLALTDAYSTIFWGMNQIHPHELSVFRVLHSFSGRDAHKIGLSIVRSTFGDLACKVVLSPMGTGWAADRKALALLGITSVNDPELPAFVAAALPNAPCDAQRHDYLEINEIIQAQHQINAAGRSRH